MTLNLKVPQSDVQLKPRITVIGVGGAGGNAVNNMIQSNLEGVEFLVTNTDAQALNHSACERRVQLGKNVTQGLGAGARPDVGRAAAEESLDEILEHIDGSNMLFVTAGMGGGTGTGAAPVLARAAREKGLLTVGVVTKPFHFEGVHRMRMAETGIQELTQYVDTLIIIPNQNLFRVANEKTTFADAFKMADDVLHAGVRGVTDLMVMPGLINLDFADIRSVMTEMGKAMMGTGEAEGDNRATAAAEAAISNPLLDDVSMKGARGVLINITGGMDMTLFEVDEAANRIRDEVDPEANIIFGSTFDENLNGAMRISVVATGIDADEVERPKPVPLSVISTRNEEKTKVVEEPPIPEKQEDDEAPAAAASTSAAEARTPLERALAQLNDERQTATGSDGASESDEEYDSGRDDMFVAPPAMEPEAEEEAAATRRQPEPAADPFAAAALANASDRRKAEAASQSEEDDKPRNRAHGLFRRVAGKASRQRNTEEAPAAPRAQQGGSPSFSPRTMETASRGATGGPTQPAASAGGSSAGQGQGSAATMRAVNTATAEQLDPEDSAPEPASRQRPATQENEKASSGGSQPRLSGLDQSNRYKASQDDKELDIPAFLRRQAN